MIDEDSFLSNAAPGLTRAYERFWISPKVTDAAQSVAYPTGVGDKLADAEDASFWFHHRNEIISAMIARFPPTGPILDVGGGVGGVALHLKDRGYSTIVLEPGYDRAMIAYRRGLTVAHSHFDASDFSPGQLPAIGLFDVIEHLDDDQKFLADCCASLREGGNAYVTVPALQTLWSADDEFAGHYRRYNCRPLVRVLNQAGFDIVALSYFFSLLIPAIFVFRALPARMGLRKVVTTEDGLRHHYAKSRLTAVAERMLAFERVTVAGGRSIPFGSSLIAVARKCRR